MNVIAVVVTYNRCQLLDECLEHLLNADIIPDILVINNASTDETEQILNKYKKFVTAITTKRNLGGAGGYNLGIQSAYIAGYKYIWLMDDDTIVQKDTLSVLLRHAKELHGNFGYLSSMAHWTDGTWCRMNQHEIAKDWQEYKDSLEYKRIKISAATFVSFLLNRTCVESVGLPISEYFIWGDDTEYSLRISQKYNCYFCFDSHVTHKMSENITTRINELNDIQRINRMYYSIRNDTCTSRRNGEKRLLTFLFYQFSELKEVIKNGKRKKLLKCLIILKGVIRGLIFRPKIEYVDLNVKEKRDID